jgi:hypothetical protein
MKADLTRDTFDPLKRFTRVLMQQGRVQVDADWNEQASILLHHLRALAADLIGPAGGPTGNCGFGLSLDAEFADDFRIGAGRYYVDGYLCELETSALPISQPEGFADNEVQLSVLVLDGIAFAQPASGRPQPHVEVFSRSTAAIVAQVTDFDAESGKLTLSKDVSTVLDGQEPRLRRVVTFLTQPDYTFAGEDAFERGNSYLVYLDVWERHISCDEDDSIREVAFNGADTATRARLVWQVKLLEGTFGDGRGSPCENFVPADPQFMPQMKAENRGRLRAQAKRDARATDPCITPPHSEYRGVENQLYRVEIHSGGTAWDGEGEPPEDGVATFKWSRENGAVTFPVRNVATDSGARTTTVTLDTLGRDDRFGLIQGDWVELVNDADALHAVTRSLLQVQDIDRSGMTVTLAGVADSSFVEASGGHPLLRRWEQKQGNPAEGGLRLGAAGAALIVESDGEQWLELEDGVRVQFAPRDADDPYVYRAGDYWLIPARVATGDVEWPTVTDEESGEVIAIALPPRGVDHHYAPLGVISVSTAGALSIASCRKQFGPLATRPPYDYAFTSAGIGTDNLASPPRRRRRAKRSGPT